MKTFLLLALIVFQSCLSKIIPIKGNYPQTPMIFNSDKSFDEVWDKLIDVFAQKGLSIRIIDRSSGLIVSNNSELSVTVEDKKGVAINQKAFIVVPLVKNSATTTLDPINGYSFDKKGFKVPNSVYGDWNVRVKKSGTGSTINVNINNVYYESTINKMNMKTNLTSYQSTGVFEKILSDMIK